jgi:hypothetical protein
MRREDRCPLERFGPPRLFSEPRDFAVLHVPANAATVVVVPAAG